jgi:APA family basic amino acid/polyamine antiporter
MSPAEAGLERRLGTADAVVIGLGSMMGAGVFAAFAPAAAAAGSGLLLGLVAAAVVAYCNATSSAQLAAQYPTSGGSYFYGRQRLGEWPGFVAGWGFVVGKTASCAAMAVTAAAYAVPGPTWAQRLAGVAAVVALTAVNLRGITRTARLAGVLVACTLVVLAVLVAAVGFSGEASMARITVTATNWHGVLQSAGLLFFAFAGYARVATLGEEVRRPERTIPRAIQLALAVVVLVYLAVAVAALAAAGPDRLAGSPTPLAVAAQAVGAGWAIPVLRVGGVLAALGSLLALVAGVGRTSLAMAREGDLPRWLASVGARHRVPDHAQVALAVVVVVLVLTTDLRGVIGFSSFGVLVYYGIANASAFTQRREHRRWPRGLQVLGMVGCALLAATLPRGDVLVGLGVFAVGLAYRLLRRRTGRRGPVTAPGSR